MLSTMHLYPVDGAAGRVEQERDAVELSRREVGAGHRRRRSGPREQGQADRVGEQLLRCACTHTRPAAPIEFHDGRRRGPVRATYGENYARLAS